MLLHTPKQIRSVSFADDIHYYFEPINCAIAFYDADSIVVVYKANVNECKISGMCILVIDKYQLIHLSG